MLVHIVSHLDVFLTQFLHSLVFVFDLFVLFLDAFPLFFAVVLPPLALQRLVRCRGLLPLEELEDDPLINSLHDVHHVRKDVPNQVEEGKYAQWTPAANTLILL